MGATDSQIGIRDGAEHLADSQICRLNLRIV